MEGTAGSDVWAASGATWAGATTGLVPGARPGGPVVRTPTARWWVLHTHARHEKRVAEVLARRGIAYYLPLVSVRHTYAKSTASFEVPLFPGYLFLCGDQAACIEARETKRIVTVIHVANQEAFQHDLSQIYRAVGSGQAVVLYPAIQPGRLCRVVRGPLAGVEGVAIRLGNRCRVYLGVSTLGQSAVVEVDAAALEVAD
jgi:transcription antitermination factor NusG